MCHLMLSIMISTNTQTRFHLLLSNEIRTRARQGPGAAAVGRVRHRQEDHVPDFFRPDLRFGRFRFSGFFLRVVNPKDHRKARVLDI